MSFNTVKKNTCRNPVRGGRGKVEKWMDVGLADELLKVEEEEEVLWMPRGQLSTEQLRMASQVRNRDHSNNSRTLVQPEKILR